MLLTPPDVISQTLLAVPMYALYELGIVFAKFMVPRKDEAGDET
jgi:sec-independent protein translocase protein TatC